MGLSDFSGMDTSHFWTNLWLKAPTSTWTWGWYLNIPNDGAEKGQGESQKDQNDWPLDTPILPLSMVINMISKQTCLQKTYRSYSCFAVSNWNKQSHLLHFGDRFPYFSMGARRLQDATPEINSPRSPQVPTPGSSKLRSVRSVFAQSSYTCDAVPWTVRSRHPMSQPTICHSSVQNHAFFFRIEKTNLDVLWQSSVVWSNPDFFVGWNANCCCQIPNVWLVKSSMPFVSRKKTGFPTSSHFQKPCLDLCRAFFDRLFEQGRLPWVLHTAGYMVLEYPWGSSWMVFCWVQHQT